jgi:hypothetical protein
MHTTNYSSTLILASPDCPVRAGTIPAKPGTIAAIQYEMLSEAPGRMSSDDLLLAVEARRKDVEDSYLAAFRKTFFAKPQACLRASPLVKSYGWGIYHDADSKIVLVGCETEEYKALAENPSIKKVAGMRSRRS